MPKKHFVFEPRKVRKFTSCDMVNYQFSKGQKEKKPASFLKRALKILCEIV